MRVYKLKSVKNLNNLDRVWVQSSFFHLNFQLKKKYKKEKIKLIRSQKMRIKILYKGILLISLVNCS